MDDDLVVTVPSWKVRHAVRTLLQNAVEAILDDDDAGYIEMEIQAGQARDESVAYISVRDSGPGVCDADGPLTPERFDVIFADGYTTRNGGSRGEGLGLARGALREHGGDLQLVAASHGDPPYVGAYFRVRLPITSPE